jgi:hypothetical protein
MYSSHAKMTFFKAPAWISVSILYILGLKLKYIYIMLNNVEQNVEQNHRVVLKQVIWLEETLEVTITYIVDIVWLEQV